MQLTTLIPLPVIILACLGGSFAVLANMLSFVMIGKINETRVENERISYFCWGTEMRNKFKQLYPENRPTYLLHFCVVLMGALFRPLD